MANQDRDFTNCVPPDMKLGQPVFGGYRMYLQFDAKAEVGVGESIKILWIIPGDEYWRLRGLFVLDSTNGGFGNGWKKQTIQCTTTSRFQTVEASSADPAPNAKYIQTKPGQFPIWQRNWDGVTYLAFTDALGSWLNIAPKDPTWNITVLPPGSRWMLYAQESEFASGAEFRFDTHLLVDRYIMPANLDKLSDTAKALWFERMQFGQMLQGQG